MTCWLIHFHIFFTNLQSYHLSYFHHTVWHRHCWSLQYAGRVSNKWISSGFYDKHSRPNVKTYSLFLALGSYFLRISTSKRFSSANCLITGRPINVWFQKISRPPPQRELEIPGGVGGGQRPRKFQRGGVWTIKSLSGVKYHFVFDLSSKIASYHTGRSFLGHNLKFII